MLTTRIARRSAAAAALLLTLAACAEERHYAVNLRGEARRVDADGNPLPGETLPDFGAQPPADATLRGTLHLDPALGLDSEAFTCVFLIAGRAGAPTSDVVRKIDHPHFPLEFTLGGDAGHGAGLKAGEYRIQAWLDGDGDALRRVGDVIGVVDGARPGGEPVTLTLTRVLVAEDLPPGTAAPVAAAPGIAPTPPGTAPAPPATAPAPHAGAPPAAPPAPGGPTAEDLAGPRFRGTIELAPEFAALDGKHPLYIILRSPKTEGGMPLAVKRVDAARFPFAFDVGTEAIPLDVDNKVEMIAGEVKLSVRLSVSGKLGGGAGDLEAAPLVTKPADGLVLRLDTRRSE